MMKVKLRNLGRGAIIKTTSFSHTSSGSFLTVTFSTTTRSDFGVDLVAHNTRITIPKEGWYMFAFNGTWGNNSTGARAMSIVVNGSVTTAITSLGANDGGAVPDMNVSGAYYCQAGDYVEGFAFQNSGGTLVLTDVTLQVIQLAGKGCRLSSTINTTATNNTERSVTFDTVTRDDFATTNLTTRNTKITIPKEGWYIFYGYGNWASNATGERYAALKLNGSVYTGTHGAGTDKGNSNPNQNMVSAYYCKAGDYMELVIFQASGGNLDFSSYAMTALQIR